MSENTKSIKSIYEREKRNTSRFYDAFSVIVPDYFEIKQFSKSYPEQLRNVATLKLIYGEKSSLPDEIINLKINDMTQYLESELELFKNFYTTPKFRSIPKICEMIMKGNTIRDIMTKNKISYTNISYIRFIVINKIASSYEVLLSG